MGLLTQEQMQNGLPKWVSIDKETGEFVHNNQQFAGLAGILLGFGSHTMTYKDREYKKFDIYIADNGDVYQLQLGMYSYRTLFLMNFLRSIDKFDNKPILFNVRKEGENINLLVKYDNKWLKSKQPYKDLKITDEKKRDKVIETWYEKFVELMPYEPEPTEVEEELDVENKDIPF